MHRSIQIAPQHAFRMLSVKGQADRRPVLRSRCAYLRWRSHPGALLCFGANCSRPSPRKTACSPHNRQLECCAHSAPPAASATAHIRTSDPPGCLPGRLRDSGNGNSRSLMSHFLQYTLPWVWARYQRQPQPSQTFNCTRNSMTDSPSVLLFPRGDQCHPSLAG